MNNPIAIDHYNKALKRGKKDYSNSLHKGDVSLLPSLEGLLKKTDIISTINLGVLEIPLRKVKGTYTHSRSTSFSRNFMPLDNNNKEFRDKWIALCDAHLNEGLRDPVKVYEFMNFFYVIEGNKRISILKYFDAHSYQAEVIRLLPKKDKSDINNLIYYEFLKFNKETNLYNIWFSQLKGFKVLLTLLKDYNPNLIMSNNKYEHFETYVYNTFRNIYYELGGNKLPITTGDAFIEYACIYGIPDKLDSQKLKQQLKQVIKELDGMLKNVKPDIQTSPTQTNQRNVLSTITNRIIPQKKLKVGFIYSRDQDSSGWTYSHELGRKYIEEIFDGQIQTSYIDNVPEDASAYDSIKILAEQGYDVIFTTSEIYANATLRCALEYPNIRFFNCSENRPYMHLSNYFGRTYEPRFLIGLIAGSLTKSNIIGYTATHPTPEVISCINAFALGCKMVNPYSKVKVAWTHEWNNPEKTTLISEKLVDASADIVSNKNLIVPRGVTKKYGTYSMLCTIDPETKLPSKYLAAPIWKWGIFYEKILNSIINDSLKTIVDIFNGSSKLINFWWGMDTGVLDIYYSKKFIPLETQKLIEIMKKTIISKEFHPFAGPVYDNKGHERIKEELTPTSDMIFNMDWFVDNVEVIE
ncbi:BMP family ABC transporter substrate-binding protein [Wukongibacter baidiensis]|uniref:BMP family ABC transporter substrate-binding protein n=1 Tax=Wukongibacter baidiensis TaxID=1723361 RepID=UPI003D7FCFC0